MLQLAFLDRIPAHAAVGESVELAKRESRRGAGLVNAVLRRAAREAPALVAALPDATPAEAALKHSHPEWIAELWFDALGPGEARALMAAGNEPAEAAVRINTLKTERLELPDPRIPRAARGPRPRRSLRRVLVAAVGAGPVHAAVARRDGGRARARPAARREGPGPVRRPRRQDDPPGRADGRRGPRRRDREAPRARGRAPAHRGADGSHLRRGPHRRRRRPARGPYDRVLVDPPCSDLGTLAARPDVRWRKDAETPQALAAMQTRILDAAAEALKPGGVLVYSTCTISPRENERLVGDFLQRRDDFAVDELPSTCRSGTIRPCPASSRRFRTATARTASSSRGSGGRDRRHVDLGDVCPCHEPWLRPTNLPGRYRCVNCLHRFELMSVCPNCGEHSTIVRMSDTALYACNHCKASMLQPI